MKTHSTKSQLTGFFSSVGITAVMLCLFTMVFFLIYAGRSQRGVRHLAEFNACSDSLTSLSHCMSLYARRETESYYLSACESLSFLEKSLEELLEDTAEPLICRELLDLSEMAAHLDAASLAMHGAVDSYLASGKADYAPVQNRLDEFQTIAQVMFIRCDDIRNLYLESSGSGYRQMRRQTWMFLLVFISGSLLILAVAIRHILKIVSDITRPAAVLTEKASLIREGKLSDSRALPVPPTSNEEFRILSQVFDDMTGQLQKQFETMAENARMRRELDEIKFKELQMQINPHFLFNTLNMISEKAYFECADETAELLRCAARMFRYSLDFSGKAVPLGQEIEELGNYVFIQEQRFGWRIRFQFDLDESIHNVTLPALTLQPLVENAIVHGVGMMTDERAIRISTSRKEEKGESFACIVVEDNGAGLSPDALKRIRDMMENYQGESVRIGLGNVAMRLRYFFKGKASISLNSREGEGTRVALLLPLAQEDRDAV